MKRAAPATGPSVTASRSLQARRRSETKTSRPCSIQERMSHNITLYCGCSVYVACHPHTGVAHTRVLEQRHPLCRVRKHEIGLRLALWELLPEPIDRMVDPRPHADR